MTWECLGRKVHAILAKIKTDKPFEYAKQHWNLYLFQLGSAASMPRSVAQATDLQ